jgi:hypothetical protein
MVLAPCLRTSNPSHLVAVYLRIHSQLLAVYALFFLLTAAICLGPISLQALAVNAFFPYS